MEVVTADDEGTGHFRRNDTASQNAATDGDIADERALLVCKGEHARVSRKTWSKEGSARTNVSTANSLCRGLEAQTNILVPPLILSSHLPADCTTQTLSINTPNFE